MERSAFADKADGMVDKVQETEDLHVNSFTIASSDYYIDRIYRNDLSDPSVAMRRVVLMDDNDAGCGSGSSGDACSERVRNGQYQVDISMSHHAFPDTVVFNPWEEGKKGAKGPDFDDDGYNYMLCIEPAVSTVPRVLAPGETWCGVKEMRELD